MLCNSNMFQSPFKDVVKTRSTQALNVQRNDHQLKLWKFLYVVEGVESDDQPLALQEPYVPGSKLPLFPYNRGWLIVRVYRAPL